MVLRLLRGRVGVVLRARGRALLGVWLLAGGCAGVAGGGGAADDGDSDAVDGQDEGPSVSPDDAASRERCRVATEASRRLLEERCASCHGGGAAGQGGFDSVLDVDAMIDTGRIRPGKPESSLLYGRLANGSMPPREVSARPTSADIAHVHDWIECGAPSQAREPDRPAFVDLDERLETMLEDLKSFDAVKRRNLRYIDLYNLANAGYSEKELDVYRDAVSFLLNSLSTGLRVVAPRRVDDRGLMFRIELADYGWTEQTWAKLVDGYPYAVQYDKDSILFPYDEESARRIREETREVIPYVMADWFVARAARPPLYYDLLEMPDSLPALEADLGIDIADNLARARVHRAGFRDAANSRSDRVVERHELGAGRGVLWLSHDFADNLGVSDVFAHPLDFEADATHALFSLPNGLFAYFAADAAGQRVDKSNNAAVQDPLSRDGAVEAGLSCLSCHGGPGVVARRDEVRESFSRSGVGGDELQRVLALYAPAPELDALFAADAASYATAREFALDAALDAQATHALNDRHLDPLAALEVAAILGIRRDELERALGAAPQNFPAAVRALLAEDGTIRRDGFEAVFPEVVRALGLGEPFRRSDLLDDDDP